MGGTKNRTEHSELIVLNKRIDEIFEKKFGERYFAYRAAWKKSTEEQQHNPEFPIQLDFELNYSCNLRCPMCTWSAEVTSTNKEMFSFERFKEIIDEGVEHGLQSVRLNYINEPLVRRDLPKFIAYCRDKGIIDIMFSSNAVLLKTPEQCRAIIEAGLTKIQFSIDAFTPETYKKVRVGTTLEKVLESVELFNRVKHEMKADLPLVRVNFVCSPDNVHEMDDFIAYWSKRDIDLIAIQHYMGLNVLTQNKVTVKNFDQKASAGPHPDFVNFKCASPFRAMTIRNSGDVLPCCTFYGAELIYGNSKSSIREIWKSAPLVAIRKLHQEGKYYENPVCKRCVESHSAFSL